MANYNQYLRKDKAPAAASLTSILTDRPCLSDDDDDDDDDYLPSIKEIIEFMSRKHSKAPTTSHVTQQVARPIETSVELSTARLNALASQEQPILIEEPYESPMEIEPLAHPLDDDASHLCHDNSVQAVQSYDADSSNMETKTCKTFKRRGKGDVYHHEKKGEWGVCKIVGQRRTESGGWEFKVVWEDSWIGESDLEGAKELLEDFRAKVRPQGGRLLRSRAKSNLQAAKGHQS